MLIQPLPENGGMPLVTPGSYPSLSKMDVSDQRRVVEVIVAAFEADPAARWMYPAGDDYRRYFPEFVRAFGGRAFVSGTVHVLRNFAGAALWLPSDIHPDDEAVMKLITRTIRPERHSPLRVVFDEMGRYHPAEPHWHLPMIGVAPAWQRRGYGSVLLQHGLQACDQHGLPAYLESSNPENIPLYEQHGFEVLGEIQVGSSPVITPMLRPGR